MRIESTNLIRLGIAGGFALLWLATPAFPAGPPPASRLLPPDSLLAIELQSPESALSAFVRSRRLFPLRPGSEALKPADEKIVWLPFLPASAALVYALELPYRDRFRRVLAGWLERSSGPCGFGLLPVGRFHAEPVLVFTFPPGAAPERIPDGFHAETEGGTWIVSPSLAATRRVKDYLARRQSPRPSRAGVDHYRLRMRLKELLFRRPAACESALSVLRYFVSQIPESIEVSWEGGEETVRVEVGSTASLLEPTNGSLRPTYVYCSVRFAGKLALPECLGALSRTLENDPLGIRTVLARAWPVPAPELRDLARHLTGRFQVVVPPSSGGLLPVLGLEVRNPRNALARLRRVLVASGVCEQRERATGVFEFPYRLPPEVRRNHMLLVFFRNHNQRREFRVAMAGGWIWLGPEREIEAVLEAFDADQETESRPNRPTPDPEAPDRERAVRSGYGRFELSTAPLWDDLLYEHGLVTLEGEATTQVIRSLRESRGELADALGPFSYEVDRSGSTLIFRRPATYEKSLLTVLAAYGYRSYQELRHEEEQVRLAAQKELKILLRAQLAHRARYGRFAETPDDLVRARLWRPDAGAGDPTYRFAFNLNTVGAPGAANRMEAGGRGTRLIVYAIPRGLSLAGRRPAYLIQEDGKLFTGRAEPGDLVRMPEGDPRDLGWRRVVE